MIADATGTLLALGWQVPGGGDAGGDLLHDNGGTFMSSDARIHVAEGLRATPDPGPVKAPPRDIC